MNMFKVVEIEDGCYKAEIYRRKYLFFWRPMGWKFSSLADAIKELAYLNADT